MHIASEEAAENATPLTEIAAFREFLRELADRCEEQPVATGASAVGTYRVFAD